MAPAQQNNPLSNNRFLVEIDGISIAGFAEVTMPHSTHEVIEYREGIDPFPARKIPGRLYFGNLVLKRGLTDSLDLYNWRKSIEDGKIKDNRKTIAVVALDTEGNPSARWEFGQAWPMKYDAPDFNASGNEIAIETLEIAHEGMRRIA